MNIAHFYLKGTCTYRYIYLLNIYHLQFKLASSRWLCRTLCKLPKQQSDICLRKGVLDFPQKDHRVSHAAIMGEFSSWEEETPSAHFVRDGERRGRWRTPPFVGGKQQALVVAIM